MADPPKNRPRLSRRRRLLIWLGAIAALAGGAYAVWDGWLDEHVIPKRWGRIAPGVYRSGMLEATLVKQTLERHDIDVLIQFNGQDLSDPKQKAMEDACDELGIELLRFPMAGDGLPPNHDVSVYADAVAAMHRARQDGKTVVIQCSAGTNRTGAVAAIYEVLILGRSGEEAYEHLLDYDWDPEDNAEMIDLANSRMGDIARMLVQCGAIDRMPEPLPVIRPPAGD